MTREEAIRMFRREIECLSHTKCKDCILEKVCDPMQTPTDDKYIEAYAMAIKALENKPYKDCISRELVLRELDKYLCGVPFDEKGIYEVIRDLPSVQPKEKTGHWIKLSVGYGCSECTLATNDYGKNMYSYCPGCGAKMSEIPTGSESEGNNGD